MKTFTKKQSTISKQLKWLFMIFIVGFFLQAVIHFTQNYFSEQLDNQIESAQIEGVIGSEIIFRIKTVEQQYYQLTTTLKPETRKIILKSVNEDIEEIKNLINVLENGGSFNQKLKLNLLLRF